MTDGEKKEKKDLIVLASKYIENGVHMTTLENTEVKKMMAKIAANAVFIGLYKFCGFVIPNISDGDFTTIKSDWEDARNDLIRCVSIIDNEGENLKDLLGVDEIKESVRYTIFEETGGSEEDE